MAAERARAFAPCPRSSWQANRACTALSASPHERAALHHQAGTCRQRRPCAARHAHASPPLTAGAAVAIAICCKQPVDAEGPRRGDGTAVRPGALSVIAVSGRPAAAGGRRQRGRWVGRLCCMGCAAGGVPCLSSQGMASKAACCTCITAADVSSGHKSVSHGACSCATLPTSLMFALSVYGCLPLNSQLEHQEFGLCGSRARPQGQLEQQQRRDGMWARHRPALGHAACAHPAALRCT